ncbi:hypothetical protein EJB05_51103, partial [Eragrostis curvula]
MVPSPPASSSPPPSAADGDGDGVDGGAVRCSSPTPAPRRRSSPNRSGGSARKSPGSRDFGGRVNKSTLHFKKSKIRRSGSPINWTPRKKTESYMKRKIKQLQETDGMTASLHETLGNANRHYTRMAREKIAAREAARKATEARKAAMVEASWCRILRAARIQSKYAEEVMEKAMLRATEAFDEARAMGVMMYDTPDCTQQQCEVESSSQTGGRSTHKVTASFQTAFQVDMEVAAAVKKAFLQLANSSDSSKKEEFKVLLQKISQNPELTEIDVNSESKEQLGDDGDGCSLRMKNESSSTSSVSSDFNSTKVQESIDIVSIMVDRLNALHEDELSSLAVIVATSGLNAVLRSDRGKCHMTETVSGTSYGSLRPQPRRYSTAASFVDVQGTKKEFTSELPSLDKFLVKHLSKLEREVQEAKETSGKPNSVKHVSLRSHSQFTGRNAKAPESADLGSILVKHRSKLEKEILEAKKSNPCTRPVEESCKDVSVSAEIDVPSRNNESECDKPQSVAESNSDLIGSCDPRRSGEGSNHIQDISDYVQDDKENKISHSHQLPPSGANSKQNGKRLTRVEAARLEALQSFCSKDGSTLDVGLDKIFLKPVHRLEKEKKEARERQSNEEKHPQKHAQSTPVIGSLDDVLVKHVSRLEREKIEYKKRSALGEGWANVPHDQRRNCNNAESSGSLDQILLKPVSQLEREKMEFEKRNALEGGGTVDQNKTLRESNSASASDSLDQILVKHVSRLEKEKMENEKKGGLTFLKKGDTHCTDGREGSLADIFVKRLTKLEQAKLAFAAEEKASGFNPVEERRKAREKELLDAWGGMGLGNSMKPQVSKIERDKVAWRKAEEEQKQICATGDI